MARRYSLRWKIKRRSFISWCLQLPCLHSVLFSVNYFESCPCCLRSSNTNARDIKDSPDFAILSFLNCFVVPQLLYHVGVQQLSPVETSDLNERGNKNMADGLAWSCYFDYLKLVNCQNWKIRLVRSKIRLVGSKIRSPYKENLCFDHSFLVWQSFPFTFMGFIINISVVLLQGEIRYLSL